MDNATFEIIQSCLSPLIVTVDNEDYSWEDYTYASLTHLMRQMQSKLSKEANVGSIAPPQIEVMENAAKLRKHLGALIILLKRSGGKIIL